MAPVNGKEPEGLRVSSTLHGGRLYNDKPPAAAGAKYPIMKRILSGVLTGETSHVKETGGVSTADRIH
jgi:hypothetical protein